MLLLSLFFITITIIIISEFCLVFSEKPESFIHTEVVMLNVKILCPIVDCMEGEHAHFILISP